MLCVFAGVRDQDNGDDVNLVSIAFAWADDDPETETKPMSTSKQRCWLLAAGCWLLRVLAVGCWLLLAAAGAAGVLVLPLPLPLPLAAGCWLLAAGWRCCCLLKLVVLLTRLVYLQCSSAAVSSGRLQRLQWRSSAARRKALARRAPQRTAFTCRAST
jgi:hypothetical protein